MITKQCSGPTEGLIVSFNAMKGTSTLRMRSSHASQTVLKFPTHFSFVSILFPFSTFPGIEQNDSVLLEKGFIETVASLTLDHISEYEFCQDSSYLLYATSESLESISQITEFFFEIKGLEVISTLLRDYRLNRKVMFNAISVLIKIIINFRPIERAGGSLKTLFESGLIEVIGTAMEKSKESMDDSFIKLCECLFSFIINTGK